MKFSEHSQLKQHNRTTKFVLVSLRLSKVADNIYLDL